MAMNPSTYSNAWARLRKMGRRGWASIDQWFGEPARVMTKRTSEAWRRWRSSPRIDLFETVRELEVRVDLPGVDPDAIDIKIRGRRLTISGHRPVESLLGGTCRVHERATGRFMRSVFLPCGTRDEQISAKYHDGVLAISLPKKVKASLETYVHVQRDSAASDSWSPTGQNAVSF